MMFVLKLVVEHLLALPGDKDHMSGNVVLTNVLGVCYIRVGKGRRMEGQKDVKAGKTDRAVSDTM
jgi:hypothetical protein